MTQDVPYFRTILGRHTPKMYLRHRDALGRNTPKMALKTGTSWVSALGRRRPREPALSLPGFIVGVVSDLAEKLMLHAASLHGRVHAGNLLALPKSFPSSQCVGQKISTGMAIISSAK